MLVFPITSQSLKTEIAVAVAECMEHLPDTKTSANKFAVFPQTSRGPRKSDFFEQNWNYLSIPFSSGADL